MIEVVGILRNAFQRPRQFRLAENVALLIEIAVALKDTARFGKLAKMFIVEARGITIAQRIAILRHADGGP